MSGKGWDGAVELLVEGKNLQIQKEKRKIPKGFVEQNEENIA